MCVKEVKLLNDSIQFEGRNMGDYGNKQEIKERKWACKRRPKDG